MVFEESICERSWRPRRNMLFQRKFAFISAKCLSCTNISVPKTQQGLSLKFSRPHNLCKIPVQIHTVAVRVTLSCFVFVFFPFLLCPGLLNAIHLSRGLLERKDLLWVFTSLEEFLYGPTVMEQGLLCSPVPRAGPAP